MDTIEVSKNTETRQTIHEVAGKFQVQQENLRFRWARDASEHIIWGDKTVGLLILAGFFRPNKHRKTKINEKHASFTP